MLRPIMTLALLLTAGGAGASESAARCDMRIVADVALSANAVIVDEGEHRLVIDRGRVSRDGRALDLDAAQGRLAEDYARGMQRLVPAVSELALRGALLGLESLALIGAGLSGDDAANAHSAARIEKLATELHLQFDGRHLPAGTLELDTALEREIGALAAEAAGQFAGSVLHFIGTALFDPEAASARGDYLERMVERRIEPRARLIEKQADRLCIDLRRLDALETELDLFNVIVDDRDELAI